MDEEQRPPAIGTYDTDPHFTEAERKAEEARGETDNEQDTAGEDAE